MTFEERLVKTAEAALILESWQAGKAKEQVLIANIVSEAAPRDRMRLAQLKAEKKQKQQEKAKLKRLKKEMNKVYRKQAREMAKLDKIHRKDMRERNRFHVSSCNRSRARSCH